jgi:hypothetical protein
VKLSPILARRLATLLLLGFLGFVIWRLYESRGSEVELVYDFSRLGRTDLQGLGVTLRQGSDRIREAEFRYPPGEATAPLQQRHRVRLREGRYQAVFVLRFAKAPDLRLILPLEVPTPQGGPAVFTLLPPR